MIMNLMEKISSEEVKIHNEHLIYHNIICLAIRCVLLASANLHHLKQTLKLKLKAIFGDEEILLTYKY